MELLHTSPHFASMVFGYIFKGLLALVVVSIVGVNLAGILAVIFGPLLEDRNRVKGQNPPISPFLTSTDEQHSPES